MSIGDDLLVILSSYSGGYRFMRRRMRGYTGPALPKRIQEASDRTLRVTFSRLKKMGLAENHKGAWSITTKGREFIAKILKKRAHRQAPGYLNKKRGKNLIIIFDVPEKYRSKRDWLRIEIVGLGFRMLQKSVWFGPAPIPKEFIEILDGMGILKYVRFFDAKESDII